MIFYMKSWKMCFNTTNSQQYAHFVTVEPCVDICIQELIKHNLTTRIHKTCYACDEDTDHIEVAQFENHKKY